MRFKCIIIDDEPLARKLIASHIVKIESLELVHQCNNAIEGMNFIQKHTIDLIFLDIQMPEVSGLDFIRTLKDPPAVILITAHRDFAPEAFDLDALDYILKPVSLERLMKSVSKFLERHKYSPEQSVPAHDGGDFVYLRAERKTYKILLDDILYIESLDDYVKVHLTDRTIISRENISSLDAKLPSRRFVRIHRSFIVSAGKITSLSGEGVEIGKTMLPFGRAYKQGAMAMLGFSAS